MNEKSAAELLGVPLSKGTYIELRGAHTLGDVLGEMAGKVKDRIEELQAEVERLGGGEGE